MPKISAYTSQPDPDPADLVPTVDVTAGETKRSTWAQVAASDAFTSQYVAAPTPWTALSYTNSWANIGGGQEPGAYRKVGDEVQLRGLIGGGSLAVAAFTLPVGFRPTSSGLRFVTTSADAYASGLIDSAGDLYLYVGATSALSLWGISFSVTA